MVKVEEPSEPTTVQMIRCLKSTLENHHKIRIRNEAVVDSVRLSNRYISGRQLPDKAVSVIDTACARINLSQNSTPPRIEDASREKSLLEMEKSSLLAESVGSVDHSDRLAEIDTRIEALDEEKKALDEKWEQEKGLVSRISELYESFSNGQDADRDQIENEIEAAENELAELQQGDPLVHACCDKNSIAETISAWTGIPLGKMVADEIQNILKMDELLKERVIGQDHALELIAKTLQFSRANLADPDKPIGVFMLAGTSGTGKTETALSLANILFGSDQNLTVINMSEFKESHKVSLLTGSPPGIRRIWQRRSTD